MEMENFGLCYCHRDPADNKNRKKSATMRIALQSKDPDALIISENFLKAPHDC